MDGFPCHPNAIKIETDPLIPSLPLVIVIFMMGSLVWWMSNREPTFTTIKYGELMQILTAARHDPNVMVQSVKVGRDDIRGEIVATDPVSDGKDNVKHPVDDFLPLTRSAWARRRQLYPQAPGRGRPCVPG